MRGETSADEAAHRGIIPVERGDTVCLADLEKFLHRSTKLSKRANAQAVLACTFEHKMGSTVISWLLNMAIQCKLTLT